MSAPDRPVEPVDVARQVESYVYDQHAAAAKFTNAPLLGQSGVYDLHSLAARIYQRGFNDGVISQAVRDDGQRQRDRAENERNTDD
ncbi:hypothetical protein MN032_17755 [Agromyces atrinae]|uniref:hypothetical protein n=1 Tax=Agromyces atrinae TaxID=592376 RepID=UPI001F57675C|nr:hypothetical protein [Agromyces atrinae]MCI2959534.1 hypothetical protein [Agromyces atrinae]